jgi:CRP-like cAMP-binding protein
MHINQAIELISNNYFELTNEAKIDFSQISNFCTVEIGTQIVKEGQSADKMYFIAKGGARAYYLKDGKDISDWFAFENEFICSINSFFLNIPSPHFIEIIEPSILIEITKSSIIQLSDKHRSFDRLSKTIVTNTLINLQQRIELSQFETAQQKYDNLLKIKPHITQRVQLTHIASYLGITLETLSRIRNPKNRI